MSWSRYFACRYVRRVSLVMVFLRWCWGADQHLLHAALLFCLLLKRFQALEQ
jgi:hypothetical protein